METHNKKRKMLLKSTFPEDINTSPDNDKKDKDSEIKITTEITIRIKIMNFNLFAEFSRFRDIKKVILRPVKSRIKAKYIKSTRSDI